MAITIYATRPETVSELLEEAGYSVSTKHTVEAIETTQEQPDPLVVIFCSIDEVDTSRKDIVVEFDAAGHLVDEGLLETDVTTIDETCVDSADADVAILDASPMGPESYGPRLYVIASFSDPPTSEQQETIVVALADNHAALRLNAAQANELNQRFEHYEEIVRFYLGQLDDMVNYTDLDFRVYELAWQVRTRLAEWKLKFVQDRLALEELQHENADFFESHALSGHPLLDEPCLVVSDPPTAGKKAKIPWSDEARAGSTRLADVFFETESSFLETLSKAEQRAARVQQFLDVGLETAKDLSEEGAAKVDTSVNMVLYWLSIITLFFGVVSFYDKYQSADTFGVPSSEALSTTLLIIVPLMLLFGLAMLRYGAVSRRLTSWFKFSLLRLYDRAQDPESWLNWFIRGRSDESQSVSALWFRWFQWRLTCLTAVDLSQMEELSAAEVDESDFQELKLHEDEAEQTIGQLWDDLDWRDAMPPDGSANTVAARRSLKNQFTRLRAQTLVRLSQDFLVLELPRPCPSPSIYFTLFLKLPTMVNTNLPQWWSFSSTLEDYFRRFLDDSGLDTTHSVSLLMERSRAVLGELYRASEDADPNLRDDGAIWQQLVDDDDDDEALETLMFSLSAHELLAATKNLRLSTLLEEHAAKEETA